MNKKWLKDIFISINRMEYVYLITEREFLKTNEPIHKIGCSKLWNCKRLIDYPNGSKQIISMTCNNSKFIENRIIKFFSEKYIRRRDIGLEYFEGDVIQMRKDFPKIVEDHDELTNEQILELHQLEEKEKKKMNDNRKLLFEERRKKQEQIESEIKKLKKEQAIDKNRLIDEIKNTRNAKSIMNIKTNNVTLPSHFRKWFENNYEITDSRKDVVSTSELYSGFIKTKFYRNITRNEKRIYNKKFFLILLSEDLFFVEYFRDRYNNIRSVLQFWRKKENVVVDEDEVIDETNLEEQEDISEEINEEENNYVNIENNKNYDENFVDFKKHNICDNNISIYEYIDQNE